MKNFITWSLATSFLLFWNYTTGQTDSIYTEFRNIELDTSVRYGKLDNGLTYYLLKNDSPPNMIRFELIVKAGHINEGKDQLEYAHLLEHLLASSTRQYPDVRGYLKKIGGYSNASISDRYSRYFVEIPSTNKAAIEAGLGLLYDKANPGNVWSKEKIDTERQAIEGEGRTLSPNQRWRSNTTITQVLENRRYPVLNQDKNLANLKNFKPNALKRFYHDWYRPDLEAVMIVGDIKLDSLEYKIREQFSSLSLNDDQQDKKIISPKDFHIELTGENRFSTIIDSAANSLNLEIVQLTRNMDREPKNAKELSSAFIQQLFRLMVASKASIFRNQYDPPFEYLNSNYGKIFLPDSQLEATSMSLTLESNALADQKKSFLRAIKAWKQLQFGLEKEDLVQAKVKLETSLQDDTQSSELSQQFINHFIYGKATLIAPNQKNIISEIIQNIQLRDVLDYAERNWNLSKNTNFVFFKPPGVNEPSPDMIKSWLKEINTIPHEPLPKMATISSLAATLKNAKNEKLQVEKWETNEIGVTTIDLAKGIKIIMKPTKPQNDIFQNRISLRAFRTIELPLDKPLDYLAAVHAPQVIQNMGAGSYDKFEIKRFEREKNISINFRNTYENQLIDGNFTLDELPEFFGLFYLYLTKPRDSQKGFDDWKDQKKMELRGHSIRGSKSFLHNKIYASWYPQVPVLELSDLDKLSKKHYIDSWETYFEGIENYTFILTGDFDTDILKEKLLDILSKFPIDNDRLKNEFFMLEFPFEKMHKRLECKNIDQVYTNIYFPVKVPTDMKTEIELELLSQALHERIYVRLRNGSYSPRATGEWVDFKNGIYAFRIEFDSALGNERFMRNEALDVFRKLKNNGVDMEWLNTTISNKVQSYERKLNSFGYLDFWQDYLHLKLENGIDPIPGILNYGTLMEYFIEMKDIKKAVNKYMQENHIQVFQTYPEKHKT